MQRETSSDRHLPTSEIKSAAEYDKLNCRKNGKMKVLSSHDWIIIEYHMDFWHQASRIHDQQDMDYYLKTAIIQNIIAYILQKSYQTNRYINNNHMKVLKQYSSTGHQTKHQKQMTRGQVCTYYHHTIAISI